MARFRFSNPLFVLESCGFETDKETFRKEYLYIDNQSFLRTEIAYSDLMGFGPFVSLSTAKQKKTTRISVVAIDE